MSDTPRPPSAIHTGTGPAATEEVVTYQTRDHEVIDYETYVLPGMEREIRGPGPTDVVPGAYFTCLGAAQTFGCLCEKPYPALLSESLGMPAVNFGFAGAGPRFFHDKEVLLDYVNKARFAVVQVMSGRSESNSVFASAGSEYLTRRADGEQMGAEPAYRHLLETQSSERVHAVVEETRANWVESYVRLLESIEVPKVLFWFSKRTPDFEDDFADVYLLFGEFPHMVNRAMVEQVRRFSDEYVECVSARGFPQRLKSRFTGKPVTITHRADLGYVWDSFDLYYPSPEMHSDANGALVGTCEKYARRRGART